VFQTHCRVSLFLKRKGGKKETRKKLKIETLKNEEKKATSYEYKIQKKERRERLTFTHARALART